jgi:outer membrane protein assembly factor BamB
VFAFDLDGRLVWKKPNGPAWDVEVSWASSYSGSRSTPTYDNGVIYQLSEAGRLSAYTSKTGDLMWSRDLTKDFIATIPTYGFAESVLVDGDNLFVRPGGEKGFLVCLNKLTGETRWTNTEIPGTNGYNSAVMMDIGGFHQVIGASSNCFFGIDSKSGKLLWKVDFENQYGVNCTDAVIFNEYVYVTTTQGKGSMLIKLTPSATSVTAEKVWQTALLDNYHGGVLLHNGYVFGSASTSRSWYCIDFMTGKPMWKSTGTGSLTYADGMLYLLDEKGSVKLLKASNVLETTGEFKAPSGGTGPYWAHPVVCGGRLYIRHAGTVFAYDIAKK